MYKTILLLFLFFTFFSCSQDEINISAEKQIIGEWKLKQSSRLISNNNNIYYEYQNYENVSYHFSENNEVIIVGNSEFDNEGNYDFELKYEVYFNPDLNQEPKTNIIVFNGNKYIVQIGSNNNSETLILTNFIDGKKRLYFEK
ncbi:hypothetical protein IU405_11565 [Polaribacter sp. BAL334]|uniref:hypothetical protein n=1 Tax=Polaribacter sp. BAL334 TaxID=1708178 RepID=UPI0018D248E6|nr:hypothetical protein [Polaribacter sp. BAL334]MBG7612884.1 hypothetical protein [Polaribacter sp. BAL334]